MKFINQNITETLTENYMPYAMSVIVSRAIPEIDGFKPSHRKLLYTMYKMGLINKNRIKSANVVGQTMKLNPHGDGAIYETLVRLSRGNQALLTPFIDSKGNFGKVYSRDMAYAASRYTEVKLDKICTEIFGDIDDNAVDFVDNYDGSEQEPVLLPTAFPNILVSANTGIAVGMASAFCGFNLNEVCTATIDRIKNPDSDIMLSMPAPDFSTGGEIILDPEEMRKIYDTGRGSFKVRSVWSCTKNVIEITQIPYTTTIEAIIDKVAELVKTGKIREISDIRDESDLSGLKIAIDLKRGTDENKLMQKLFKMTSLMDSCSCNFNLLINGMPRVLGVGAIIDEWVAWRTDCQKRKIFTDISRKKDKLHLLKGLRKILLDIDKAITIIRETEEDNEVIPNLMMGFGIDKIQADYVAEIRLRNINKEYILKRVEETDTLAKEIERLEDILNSKAKVRNIIVKELESINKKYKTPRKSTICYDIHEVKFDEEDHIEDYPVNLFLSSEGYFKKITPQSFRMNSEQKLKDGDKIIQSFETTNKVEVIFLTNKQKAYKARVFDFDDTKASSLGDYVATKLAMDEGEVPVFMLLPDDYSGFLVVAFENGKVAKIDMKGFETKTNRKKLTGAYYDKEPAVGFYHIKDETDIVLISTAMRAVIINTAALSAKTSKTTQGVSVMVLRAKNKLEKVMSLEESGFVDSARYRAKAIPSVGAIIREKGVEGEQLELL